LHSSFRFKAIQVPHPRGDQGKPPGSLTPTTYVAEKSNNDIVSPPNNFLNADLEMGGKAGASA